MLYQLKSCLLSYSNYQIQDENGDAIYQIKGKFWSFGHNLSFETSDGVQIGEIRQKLMAFMPRYDLYVGTKLYASIRKEFTWFKKSFTLDIPGPNDYTIQGNFWDYEYVFTRKKRTVATVSKKFLSLTDAYGVETEKGEDDVAILAAVVAINMCRRDEKSAV